MRFEKYIPERLIAKNSSYLFGYQNGTIIIRDSATKRVVREKRIHSKLQSIGLIERFFRYEVRVGVSVDSDTFLFSDHGGIYRYSISNDELKLEHKYINGMNNPISFCVRKDFSGCVTEVLYGEYLWNENKDAVSIYKRLENGTWKNVFSFPSGSITHIHNISFDEYNQRYIVLTGDEDTESAIWETDIEFSYMREIVRGSQQYRSCIINIFDGMMYYATDTPLETNWLYRLRESDRTINPVCELPGPVIYGRVVDNELYFATSVEGNPNLGKWKYRISNKLGPGVKDRFVHVFKCDTNGHVFELDTLKKDIFPMWAFQFGNVLFPQTDDSCIYICPQSIKKKKGTYILLDK